MKRIATMYTHIYIHTYTYNIYISEYPLLRYTHDLSRSRQTTRLAYVVARTWANVTLVISSTIAFITVELVSANSKGSNFWPLHALSLLSRQSSCYSYSKFNEFNI